MTLIDKLYYEIGKQDNELKLAKVWKDKNGEVRWSKHRNYLDAQANDKFMSEVNNRTILQCEIVLDYDPKEEEDVEQFEKRFRTELSKLDSDGYSYSAYSTGSRGYHVHLFFSQELAQLGQGKRKKLKEFFIGKYGAELLKAGNGVMIALEGVPHWKSGKPKTLIKERPGKNSAVALISEYEEHIKQLQKIPKEQFYQEVMGLLAEGDFAAAIQITAEYFTQNEHMLTFQDTDETYIYQNGVYVSDGQKIISTRIEAQLKEFCNTRFVNELFNKLKRMTYVARKDCTEPLMKICLENGILNLETMQVEPHNPDECFFNKLPVIYNHTVDCPNIKKFLMEVVPEDTTPVLQEIIGYCLYKAYPIHKAVMLVGVGANGKSTFICLLKAFLGSQNCSSIPIQQLETNRFASSALHGKLANLFADLPASALNETSHFKMLTGQDVVDAERKFKDKFSFLSYAKLVFSCNKVPKSPDDSDAFFRRWVILTFPNQFIGVADDKNLLQKLTTSEELSGLLNFAIEGLKRLLQQGDFSNAASIQQVRDTYIRMSDSVAAFALDHVLISSEDYIPKKELYTAYTDYCRSRTYPAVAENTFHRDLQKQLRVEDYYPKLEGGRVKCWKGIKLQTGAVLNSEKGSQPSQPSHEAQKAPVASQEDVNPVNDVKVFPNLRNHSKLLSIFGELVASCRDGLVPREKLDTTAALNGINREAVDAWVTVTRGKGDICEPRAGFLAAVSGHKKLTEEKIEGE